MHAIQAKLKKAYSFIAPYLSIVGIFLAAILLLKITETILFFSQEKAKFFLTLYPRVLYNLIVYAFMATAIMPLYALIRIVSKKAAAVPALIFAILFLTEVGLTIYSILTGTPLNSEIIIRPLKEILVTANSVVHWWISVPLILGSIALFVLLALRSSQRKLPLWAGIPLLLLIFGNAPFIGSVTKLTEGNHKPKTFNYITNKSWYCLLSCRDYIQYQQMAKNHQTEESRLAVDEQLLQDFLSEYPDRRVPDPLYPLERENDVPDVLSNYFQFRKEKPNIVILIVESLGEEWFEDICFAPYIDSLAQQGLYWNNCLSSTSRSFGVVPAITGSLPGGMRGFQFGNMPQHNSLLSILKNNGYYSSGFYGCDWAFDCVLDYMLAQQPDYLSPFHAEYLKNKDPMIGKWWGLHDHILFRRTIEHIQQEPATHPRMDLLITISTHDELELGDETMQKHYIERTKQLIAQGNAQTKQRWEPHVQRAAGIVYDDDCIRRFIHDYCARPGGENTIFVITGDHSAAIDPENRLSYYHVPLIIWSPLLKQSRRFPALVTHHDVPPTLTALLSAQGFINPPQHIQWIGKELDTSSTFRSQTRMIILDYSHEIKEMVYDNHLYFNGNRWTKETVYEIDKNLALKVVDDPALREKFANKLSLYKYINNYVYHNDRLTQHAINQSSQFINLLNYTYPPEIQCSNPEYKPSEKSHKVYYLMTPRKINDSQKWDRIKITFKADVQISDSLYQDQHMNLVLACEGENMQYPTTYKDKIIKFIPANEVKKGNWYSVHVTKEFKVTGAEKIKTFVAVNTPEYDELWVPGCQMSVRNLAVNIEGLPLQQ